MTAGSVLPRAQRACSPPSVLALALILWAAKGSSAGPPADRVEWLPGLGGPLPSALFSGFLNTGEHRVHYTLVESERSPADDPLVLWLNGGPGSSSLIGLFQELGPVVVAGDSTLVRNPYAWSRVANVLFLESPTGVGFSSCLESRNGGLCLHNDTSTALLNFDSLKRFVELFPEYTGRDFMIWGESYAGVYIPTLAELVYNGDLQLNFLGVAAGDPCTSEEFQHIDDRLVFNLKFARDNGFIASDVYDFIEGSCVQRKGGVGHNIPNYTLPGCRAAWRVYYIATSNADGSGPSATLPHGGFIDPYSSYGPNSADFNLEMSAYLSNRAVQKALNVLGEDGEPKRWGERRLNYTRQYLACFYDTDTDPGLRPHFNSSMLPVYGRLAGKLRTIIVFNGDTDPCVQYRGTEAAVRALGLGLPTSGSWRPWFYRQRPVPLSLLDEKPPFWGPSLSRRPLPGAQLGGYVISYGSNVTFATVHGSGHMVPMFQPQAALHFFERVLRGLPLAPPLNTAALDVATDQEFFGDGYMEQWVSRAQSHEFTASEGLGRAEDEASVSNSRPIEVA